jgi:hypothetical protein
MRATRPHRLRLFAPLLALALVGQSGFLVGHVRNVSDVATPAAEWTASAVILDAGHVDCPICRALAQARTALAPESARADVAFASGVHLPLAAPPAPRSAPSLDGERARAPPRSA